MQLDDEPKSVSSPSPSPVLSQPKEESSITPVEVEQPPPPREEPKENRPPLPSKVSS
jgi:hypothetical protein